MLLANLLTLPCRMSTFPYHCLLATHAWLSRVLWTRQASSYMTRLRTAMSSTWQFTATLLTTWPQFITATLWPSYAFPAVTSWLYNFRAWWTRAWNIHCAKLFIFLYVSKNELSVFNLLLVYELHNWNFENFITKNFKFL